MTHRAFILTALFGATILAGSGCEQDHPDRDNRDRVSRRDRIDRAGDRYDPDARPAAGDVVIGRRDRWDPPAGAPRGMEAIPPTAVRVTQGTDQRLTYEPERDGRVYVYDADAGRLVYAGRIRATDRVLVDARSGDVLVNDQSVATFDRASGHRVRVYFDQGR